MNDFLFLRPIVLLLLIPFVAFIYWHKRTRSRSSIWSQACAKDLLPYLLITKGKQRAFGYLLSLLTGILLITALAGPSWQLMSEPLLKSQSGLVIALDLSHDMDARDIKPSRLQRAIYKITDLLAMRKEGQTALIVFSDDAYLVTPLTDDVGAIQALLPALDTTIMPAAGHQTDKAIVKGAELFKQAGISNGTILLITSTLSKQEMEKSIAIAAKEGLTISVLGIGNEEGAPIPMQEGGFVKNAQGGVVVSMLAKENLVQLAKSANGAFASITTDNKDLETLAKNDRFGTLAHVQEELQTHANRHHDQGYVLVLLSLPLAALFFRRGLLVVALFLLPHGLQALSWDDFWKTPDQQAENYYHQKEYQKAKELFQKDEWKGAASYQLGEFEQAADLFEADHTAEGFYNYGTAKAKQKDYEAALEAYAKALELQPDHEDALYNKQLIEQLQQQQQQQQGDKDKQEQDQSSQQKNSEKNGNDSSQESSSDKQNSKEKEQPEDASSDQGKNEQERQGNNQKQQKDREAADGKEEAQKDQLRERYQDEIDRKMEEQKNDQVKAEAMGEENMPEEDVQRQVDDRWLQKVKDDPGGLLRRKFLHQYRQQKGRR